MVSDTGRIVGVADRRTVRIGWYWNVELDDDGDVGVGVRRGTTDTATVGTGTSTGEGTSATSSQSRAVSDAYAVAMSRQAGQTGSLGVVPSFGVSVSKQTLDAAKKVVGDILEATMVRYLDGIEGGGYLYQMFLVAEDRATLMTGAALLKDRVLGSWHQGRPGVPAVPHDHRLLRRPDGIPGTPPRNVTGCSLMPRPSRRTVAVSR